MRYGLMLLLALLPGCDRNEGQVRTYELQYADPAAAMNMVREKSGDLVDITATIGKGMRTVTLQGDPAQLEEVMAALREYDRPRVVRFRFQLIEANGFATTDSAIADVESALRGLFRFRGYRLSAEAVVQGEAPGHVRQQIFTADGMPMTINVDITRAIATAAGTAVSLNVDLGTLGNSILSTSLTVPDGKTAVVGSARAMLETATYILVVRPEIQ